MAYDEEKIIDKILGGETAFFEFLIRNYQQRIFTLCMGFVHNKNDAQDISQEVFFNAYLSLSKFRRRSQFSTWLYRIAVNCSLEFIRKQNSRTLAHSQELTQTLVDKISSNADMPDKIVINNQHQKLLSDAMNTLPEKQRTVFVLSKYENLSGKEIAQIMHLNDGAVESLLSRAKQNLKSYIEKRFSQNDLY